MPAAACEDEAALADAAVLADAAALVEAAAPDDAELDDALDAVLLFRPCAHPTSPAAAPSVEMPASCRNLRLVMLLFIILILPRKP